MATCEKCKECGEHKHNMLYRIDEDGNRYSICADCANKGHTYAIYLEHVSIGGYPIKDLPDDVFLGRTFASSQNEAVQLFCKEKHIKKTVGDFVETCIGAYCKRICAHRI